MPALSSRQEENKLHQKSILFRYSLPQETIYWPAGSFSWRGQQCLETDSNILPLTRDSQRNFSALTLFAICLAATWAMHSSHQLKSFFVLIVFMRTRCSWVSLDLSHTDTAGSNLIRHKQVSSPLKQPFVLQPTGMFRHLKIFNWLVDLL